MSFVCAIPSFRRHQTLMEKTLSYLQTTTLHPSRCYIFVADREEEAIYRANVPKDLYREIIVGVRGIPQQRNFIQKYFPEKTRLFMIDDDIKSLKIMVDDKKTMRDVFDLYGLVNDSFDLIEARSLRFWGTSAVANPFYMKDTITFDYKYIVGNVIGMINSHERRFMVDEGFECAARLNFSAGKESHERGVRYFLADGGIMRHNHIAPESKYWQGEGGHQVSRNAEGEKAVSLWLNEKFPGFFKVIRRDNGMWDLKTTRHLSRWRRIEGEPMKPYKNY